MESFRKRTILGGEFGLYTLDWDDGVWSFSEFAFDISPGGEIAQPYWAYHNNVAIRPSALTGSITIEANFPVWTNGHVGLRIRYGKREIVVTQRLSATLLQGTVTSSLPPSFSIGVEEGKHYQEKEWWTEEDRKTYWDVLKPYNVAAIFTGHAHKYEEWYLPWDGENIGETNVATDFIPTFVAGAAREGYYLDCILVNDTMTISRYNIDSLLDVRKIHVKRGKGK